MASHHRSVAEQKDTLIGALVGGRYRVMRLLGRGGMGAVYEATQESLGRRVAVKILLPHLAERADAVMRFQREAQAAGQLGHANIVQTTDFGRSEDGSLFLVMDYLEGRSLADALQAQSPFEPGRAAFIAWQVLEALEVAHGAGIVHRDLKPDNVFLTQVSGMRDVVKLLDFGIAKLVDTGGDPALTATGAILGTPAYMSPEQARGAPVDARTDLYSVGVMLYEMLSGRWPVDAENYNAMIVAILTETPAPLFALRPGLDPGLVAVVEQAMAKDVNARYQSAQAMADALEPFVRESGVVRSEPALAVAKTLPSATATAPLPTPEPGLATPEASVQASDPDAQTGRRRSWLPWVILGGAVLLGSGAAATYTAMRWASLDAASAVSVASDVVPAAVDAAVKPPTVAGEVAVPSDEVVAGASDAGPGVPTKVAKAAVPVRPQARRPPPRPRTKARKKAPLGEPTLSTAALDSDGCPRDRPRGAAPMPDVLPAETAASTPRGTRIVFTGSNARAKYAAAHVRALIMSASGPMTQCYSDYELALTTWRLRVDVNGRVTAAVSRVTDSHPGERACMQRVLTGLDFQQAPRCGPGEIDVWLSEREQ
jgi:serine/threonine-protein kinase